MLKWGQLLLVAAPFAVCAAVQAQSTQQLVQQAVNTELHDDASDHSHWIYYEVDRKPSSTVEQWVAETSQGTLTCVVAKNGQKFSKEQQLAAMNAFINNPAAQAKRKKGAQHDDRQAQQLLQSLPTAFLWTQGPTTNGNTVFYFKPNPQYNPPTWQARVFDAMAGEMTVNDAQHRIVSLQGHLLHDVKIFFGLLADLYAGGSFEMQRQELAPGIWRITQTHVHIQGHALVFKSISEQEDDVKWNFKQLPAYITLNEAEQDLLKQAN